MSDEILNYPGNSKSSPEEVETRKKLESAVTKPGVKRKKGLGSQLAEAFTGEDARSVSEYILFDVLIPAAKNTLLDSVTQGFERLLMGDSSPRARQGNSRSGHVSYNRMYSSDPRNSPRDISRRAKANHDFDEIVLDSRGEAEGVLDMLSTLIEEYDVASVADFYDLAEVTASIQDAKWGWSDLRTASVRRVREGYIVSLPKPHPLD